ncbi:IS3 family transposase [Bifidobacterium adolescentis]|nr:IS3 family transposase [Bifidobacterium adolescentis]MDB0584143.1 IS3 family transposase [Bifidobacterium adolescentis]MDB0591664.1 IS3 family transposase [Bifidobacterium adolescentis]MDB0595538.1 IS3 family transposase [Bifidobacterium adolescentis]MDB0604440.1 IS3 family transposase [Bifidobacterium adolescentis]MDB0619152.1 IS3 family transposase [Bifidobacterium adolescentis]
MADPKHPRHYEESFKRQIVQLYENGKPAREIKAEYDISHSTLHRWVQGIRNSGSTKAADNRTPEQNELIELRKRNRQLEMEVDVLKQAALIFARKLAVIRANASRYPISAQCRILGVPRSTYYWMIEHPEAERVDPIAGDVHAIWRDSHERYGARKIKAALERRGVTASRRRIVNIMKRRGMTSAYARRTFKPHKTRVNEARLANILDREFDGYEPRTHLASDLTYVRVGGKWAYVCLLIDLANRSIAGHSADTGRTADLVMAAFATLDFPLTEVEVFHTDRGSEFDNAKIDELLDVFDIRRSLSRKGNPYDNAVVESTNRLLKKELIYRNHYTSLEQLRSDLNDYVWWSDNQRLHSTLGYRSPKEFTEQGLVL